MADLSSHRHTVLTNGVAVRYASTGHLLVVRASGALVAAAFDQKRLKVSGEWKQIASGLRVGPAPHCAVDLALSATGRLGYTTAQVGVVGGQSQAFAPVWVRRDGSATQVEAGWTVLTHFNGGIGISPDGTRLALTAFADGVAGG